ncbi:transcriptional regulator with XRE-family HTH domain [Pseudoxanthomonas japonensis]|uniref:helix-turn-helix domain-containing protein n=1 Tax=Pseudoxanthomonas japonensis TaxID=69284 RepID=UPI002864E624|nr:helix-turn-helix transcriptional regulator [Pseudoxanthomonas japonensis]MDR7067841.1 transcriptional regulator with XRE-family HTH domain [Pseudoxanthomonas japonensis]
MKLNAERIRTLRERRAWSQEHLASFAGLSARTLQRIEAGSAATHETCMALAAALEVPVVDLVGSGAEGGATGSPTTVDPMAAKVPTWVVMALLLVLLVVWFGYTVGKDAALRDNRADTTCTSDAAACDESRDPVTL